MTVSAPEIAPQETTLLSPPTDDVVISVRNVGKMYRIYDRPQDRLKHMLLWRFGRHYGREFWALRDVSFEVKKGETVGIVGRNGSGKSTLLQIVAGTLNPSTGSVQTRGRVAALLELGAGFNIEFTGRENIYINASILGLQKEEIDARYSDIVAFADIGDFIDQPVKTYSSGMYARLAFSVAISVNPEILIVDETLAVGDARFVAKCMRRIKEIQQSGATVLFVSHDVSSVRTLCDRAIWLENGRLIEDGGVFLVTGKYMEFLFKDDVSQGATEGQDIRNQEVHSQEEPSLVVVDESVDNSELKPDARPVTHWGSRKGLILGASICDENGVRRDVIRHGKPIKVIIDVRVPADIPRECLSVAFSIKDLKGTDLIVSTTYDYKILLPTLERFRVIFQMINPLVTGKYLLVAAVEDRTSRYIHYYEYFEGVHYFSSLAEYQFFGIFQPEIQHIVHAVQEV